MASTLQNYAKIHSDDLGSFFIAVQISILDSLKADNRKTNMFTTKIFQHSLISSVNADNTGQQNFTFFVP
jgi:hypothetical protein